LFWHNTAPDFEVIFLEDAKSAAHRIEAPKLPDALPQFTMKATVEATMKDGAEKEYTKEIEVAARSSYASLLSECGKPLPVFVRRERSRRNSLSRDGPRTKKAVIAHRSPKSPAHLLLLSANSHEEYLVLLPLPVSKPSRSSFPTPPLLCHWCMGSYVEARGVEPSPSDRYCVDNEFPREVDGPEQSRSPMAINSHWQGTGGFVP
jgi:hypothetical protein